MNSEADLGYLRDAFSFVPVGLVQRATTFQQGQGLVAGKLTRSRDCPWDCSAAVMPHCSGPRYRLTARPPMLSPFPSSILRRPRRRHRALATRTAEAGLDPLLLAASYAHPWTPRWGAETTRAWTNSTRPSVCPGPRQPCSRRRLLSRHHWPPKSPRRFWTCGCGLRAGALTGEPNQRGAGLARRLDRHLPLKEDGNGKGPHRR